VERQDNISDYEILTEWYDYAAKQPGFVGSALGLLRARQSITPQQQQSEFGANDQAFLRMQAMPLPRPQSFAGDAHRIAEACGLANSLAFVQAMILARSLERTESQTDAEVSYRAAFDQEDDLDQVPNKE
jgi:hypothetical protein